MCAQRVYPSYTGAKHSVRVLRCYYVVNAFSRVKSQNVLMSML